jgi:hypothetical protein
MAVEEFKHLERRLQYTTARHTRQIEEPQKPAQANVRAERLERPRPTYLVTPGQVR